MPSSFLQLSYLRLQLIKNVEISSNLYYKEIVFIAEIFKNNALFQSHINIRLSKTL